MELKSLNQHVANSLREYNLSSEQLRKLKELQHTDEQLNLSSNSKLKKTTFFSLKPSVYLNGIAACIILFLSFILFSDPMDLAEDISYEVVSNHIVLRPLEFKSSNVKLIKTQLDALNFTPIPSKVFNKGLGHLLGGRYCSIQRSLAVQLRYDMGNGKTATLYETAYNAKKFSFLPNVNNGEKPLEHRMQGMLVRLWVEQGLVFASVNE